MPRRIDRPITRGFRALLPLLLVAVVGSFAAGAPVARAALPVQVPKSPDSSPTGFTLTPREARAKADRLGAVRDARREHPSLRSRLVVPGYFGDRRYEVVYLVDGRVLVDVHIDGETGAVKEVWTGPQADTLLARGYEPSVGRSQNAPYVWLPLALLFVAPFVHWRRPLRLIHLDMLALLSFGASQYFFNRGQIDVSVPLAYVPLVYLLARLSLAAFRPRPRPGRLIPVVPIGWLLVGLVVLVGFRITLNAVDSHVIDVGYASVFGADRLQHGEPLYERGGDLDDTYGPVTYLAYLPFEALFPADGPGGYGPAARAAAVTWDLLVIAGLLLLGTRLQTGRAGRRLGLALAYAWCAYPFSLYALNANTNDGLIAALVVFAVVALSSAPLRGFLLGLATAAKFAPLALAPLLAAGRTRSARDGLIALATLSLTIAVAVASHLPEGGLREFWDATIGYQLARESPFSLWGLHPGLDWLQTLLKLAACALAITAAVLPRERDVRQIAALAAAVLIAVQLTAAYWFYLYIVWFAPLALVVILTAYGSPSSRRVEAEPAEAAATA